MDEKYLKELILYLSQNMTTERFTRMNEVVNERTRHITLDLENIYQSQNASAVLRTCECLGVQDIHFIESIHSYQLNKDVVKGSNQWLTLHRYKKDKNPIQSCVSKLKELGYSIIATSPHKDGYTPETLPLNKKIAIVMGTEVEGMSNEFMDEADGYLRSPMHGFTESMNISVSAAIILNRLIERLKPLNEDWRLTKLEKNELIFEWMKRSIKKSDLIISEFFTNRSE
jgi:tRNA (guanosine-2'-O-)-methyltransferase